jgi:signal transduction histidine kinase
VPKEPDTGDKAFPTLGVVLVGIVIAVAVAREFLSDNGRGSAVARPAIILSGVLLDIPVLAALSRRMDAAHWSFLRTLLSTFALNLLLGVAYLFGMRALGIGLGVGAAASLSTFGVIRFGGMWSVQIFALWTLGFRYPKAARDAALRSQESERLREHAELVQLRAHLQPHFLRNTLNAIAALVTENPRESRRLLATLGDLLSDSLESSVPMHTLDREMAWLSRYAEILATRYHGALSFNWDVPEAIGRAMLPTLLLQPLVENAVMHGALSRDGGGEVAVTAKRSDGGGLEIVVEDNGPGMSVDPGESKGLGLRLVRRRLELECPRATFSIVSSAAGTRAIVMFP